jgi:hypothetical protein
MTPPSGRGLPEALERAATALPADSGDIRPANGDPIQLHRVLGPEAATRVLQWLLENEPVDGGRLADAWAEKPDLDPTPLLEVDERNLPKVAKKALRRAQHRLRSRGLAVDRPGAEKVVATLGRVEDELGVAVLTPVDPRGIRVAYLVEGNPSGGARVFEVMLDEERGIVGFEAFNTGRSKARRFVRELLQRDRRPPVEAPPDAVRTLIARVAGYQRSNRPAPRGFSEWRSRVANAPEGTLTPGEAVREVLGEVDPGCVAHAAELIRQRELGPWPPDTPALQSTAEKIVEIEKSDLVLSASARREQADRIIDEALAEIFVAPFAPRCAERFEEMGYVYWKWGRDDDARACLAAADAFRRPKPAEEPLARVMLEVLLAPVLGGLQEEASEEEDSLIVKP